MVFKSDPCVVCTSTNLLFRVRRCFWTAQRVYMYPEHRLITQRPIFVRIFFSWTSHGDGGGGGQELKCMLHVGAPHTEHAPPYTCDPFVPSPHPYSRKKAVRALGLWKGQKHTHTTRSRGARVGEGAGQW